MKVLEIEELHELEGDWAKDDFVALLQTFDVDGAAELSPQEAEEMCLLALQDLEPTEAAAALLNYKLGDVLTAGQIQNFSSECQDERLWEQSAEMELHRTMFGVAGLLARVSDQHFPTPGALRITLQFDCDAETAAAFDDPIDAAVIARLIAAGMESSAVLHRLFSDQLAGADFAEAANIIWDASAERNNDSVTLMVTSSDYWLGPIRQTESFDWPGCLASPS